MIDLETLGTRPGCSILSIGAVVFSRDGVWKDGFHQVINRDSCRLAGLSEDPGTLAFWAKQSEEARATLVTASQGGRGLEEALKAFSSWLLDISLTEGPPHVWGNGADFDQPILAWAYFVCGLSLPWKYYDSRCYRTLKNLWPGVAPPPRQGTHHNALDDARFQAEHAALILKEMAR
jgi:hypothetical protein